MKLSVYIPTLKRDELFDRCLASIRASVPPSRTEGVDYEIVVVENVKPLSEARNVGVRRSRGDWIATVDADDTVTEAWFTEIWTAIEKAEQMKDVDDIVFDMVAVSPRHSRVFSYGREPVVDAKILVDDLLRDLRIGSHICRHVMRRRLVEDFTFERMRLLEDYVSLPKILARARKALYVPKPLYRYISRSDSLCMSARKSEFFDIAVRRAAECGGAAVIGASKMAYDVLRDRTDENGAARRWIRRHIGRELTDPGIPWKWRIKFLSAAFGVIFRRPGFR